MPSVRQGRLASAWQGWPAKGCQGQARPGKAAQGQPKLPKSCTGPARVVHSRQGLARASRGGQGKFSSVVFFGPISYSFMAVTILDWGSTEGAELELRLGGQGIGSQSNLIQRQNNGLFYFRYSSFYLSDYCSLDTGIPVHLLTISAVTANPFYAVGIHSVESILKLTAHTKEFIPF
ncbi:hypothetical protein ZIOFF_073164 [Zingiber officinale]|uniref:Uncharacterized protein n=1 Tax=Zingiber officinale TaxID=94328 RepID=A0A8J5BZQ5_ZINOF|nr:hypothetical protein ZIOFF_073164 [Zingiber officinale]